LPRAKAVKTALLPVAFTVAVMRSLLYLIVALLR
jgi:hypothetical protein